MMKTASFWNDLPQPIVGLAPMDGVTDSAFRYITPGMAARYQLHGIYADRTDRIGSRPGIWPISVTAKFERPVIAQFSGRTPIHFIA